MNNCPHCGLFRYDLSGCICSDQDTHFDWNKRYIDEIFNAKNGHVQASKKMKIQQNLSDR
ncbi:hypothetical protein AWM68_11595 [Fictibacillus phosphorivorans]|uniref:Uncharacterized protein n=1 Tax=Fictibacillus phosphorivorans TaxID=1221500 RepID=A0A163PMZ4_9BACL|nr:hypothetical protein [Fictibacillus phosphorivorans]KZE63751.1 hypothetical protein AWM68_11595 [Fictibacillus phosphorivorans]